MSTDETTVSSDPQKLAVGILASLAGLANGKFDLCGVGGDSEGIMSQRTAFLGKLLGLYCIALSLSMFAHPQATVEIMREIIHDPPSLFIAGLLGMTAGLAIVLAHNVWSGGALPIIVTLFGWASLTKGFLLLLLSPETESRVFIVGLRYEQHPSLFAALLLLAGACLCYTGFTFTTRSLK